MEHNDGTFLEALKQEGRGGQGPPGGMTKMDRAKGPRMELVAATSATGPGAWTASQKQVGK